MGTRNRACDGMEDAALAMLAGEKSDKLCHYYAACT